MSDTMQLKENILADYGRSVAALQGSLFGASYPGPAIGPGQLGSRLHATDGLQPEVVAASARKATRPGNMRRIHRLGRRMAKGARGFLPGLAIDLLGGFLDDLVNNHDRKQKAADRTCDAAYIAGAIDKECLGAISGIVRSAYTTITGLVHAANVLSPVMPAQAKVAFMAAAFLLDQVGPLVMMLLNDRDTNLSDLWDDVIRELEKVLSELNPDTPRGLDNDLECTPGKSKPAPPPEPEDPCHPPADNGTHGKDGKENKECTDSKDGTDGKDDANGHHDPGDTCTPPEDKGDGGNHNPSTGPQAVGPGGGAAPGTCGPNDNQTGSDNSTPGGSNPRTPAPGATPGGGGAGSAPAGAGSGAVPGGGAQPCPQNTRPGTITDAKTHAQSGGGNDGIKDPISTSPNGTGTADCGNRTVTNRTPGNPGAAVPPATGTPVPAAPGSAAAATGKNVCGIPTTPAGQPGTQTPASSGKNGGSGDGKDGHCGCGDSHGRDSGEPHTPPVDTDGDNPSADNPREEPDSADRVEPDSRDSDTGDGDSGSEQGSSGSTGLFGEITGFFDDLLPDGFITEIVTGLVGTVGISLLTAGINDFVQHLPERIQQFIDTFAPPPPPPAPPVADCPASAPEPAAATPPEPAPAPAPAPAPQPAPAPAAQPAPAPQPAVATRPGPQPGQPNQPVVCTPAPAGQPAGSDDDHAGADVKVRKAGAW
ncbi:hypothetical protein ACFSSC_01930 [Corynebacterium mendelii]|uniref:Uncharacterized protein n=1 Tax=Corynebacterium mendelii TaxID=2765362 RepID=A0A939E1M6_9CORY|nr:hypothetical protein [Corynebacterium mendelii]MBN9644041.1 hypothetical protein [Corynebacterium mendelii]